MHKAILTAAALAALAVSAVAQQGGTGGQSQTGLQTPPQTGALSESSQALAGYRISPQQLSSSQVRAIQQALEERGDSSVRVNGEWGPDTEAAIKNFQKSENMISQTGELDFQTLLALGLDPLGLGLAGEGETTGQAPRGDASQQQRMPGTPGETPPHSGGGQVR
jgi:peptidoglycan hydrolase-like protein with peptidoglycan-binding domain